MFSIEKAPQKSVLIDFRTMVRIASSHFVSENARLRASSRFSSSVSSRLLTRGLALASGVAAGAAAAAPAFLRFFFMAAPPAGW
jgi:hypothetical protein